MPYVVYHATLLPDVVKDEDYFDYLETNEWFDRPQTEKTKGNSDGTKQILERRSKGSESGLLRCDQDGEQVLRDRHVQERVHQSESGAEDRRTEESRAQAEVIEEKPKKRGRPQRKAS